MTRVLVTNDDGVESPGLLALAAAAVEADFDVVVAAPSQQYSGAGASIVATREDGRIPFTARRPDVFEGATVYAVDAAPALITLLGVHGVFGTPPDLVLSGINHGANAGRAVIHSGTVGAALTAGLNGARALAVSLDVGLDPSGLHWETAAAVAGRLLPALADVEVGTVLNLNVPDVAVASDLHLVEAALSDFGVVQTTMTEQDGDDVRLVVRESASVLEEGSDAALLRSGHATVTALRSVDAAPLPLAVRDLLAGA